MAVPSHLEAIQPQLLYPREKLCEATGLGLTAIRKAQKQGLRVRFVGGRAFILGEDWIDYTLEFGKPEKDA